MEDFTKGHQRHSKRNYLRRKQNERSSFSINVSDELPTTEGRRRYIFKERQR